MNPEDSCLKQHMNIKLIDPSERLAIKTSVQEYKSHLRVLQHQKQEISDFERISSSTIKYIDMEKFSMDRLAGESFDTKRRLLLLWWSLRHTSNLETVLAVLSLEEKTSKSLSPAFTEAAIMDLPFGFLVLHLNTVLYEVKCENQIQVLLSVVKTYFLYCSSMLNTFNGYQPTDSEVWLIDIMKKYFNWALIHLKTIQQIFDAEDKVWSAVNAAPKSSIITFDELLMIVGSSRPFTSSLIEKIFYEDERFGIQKILNLNRRIKRETIKFFENVKSRMDSQFENIKTDDREGKVTMKRNDSSKKKQKKVVKHQETDLVKTRTINDSETISIAPAKREKVDTHGLQIQKQKANKISKAAAKNAKQKQKHTRLVAEIEISEKDDDEINGYYKALNPQVNSTFLENQANQICKKSLKGSVYRHSIFPEISASPETMRFLCNLMVSGTPTYEDFCDAHCDLGGVKVEKLNGQILFFFEEPISYHKTLHAPHLSSRFDHKLYRRFYRNCGLHPFFFQAVE